MLAERSPPHRVVAGPRLGPEPHLGHLPGGRLGEGGRDPDVAGEPLGAEIGLRREPLGEGVGIEVLPRDRLEGHHDLVARARRGVGDGVDGGHRQVGMARDDRLDRAGGEVLRIDAQPVSRPAGEVEEPVGVDVAEVPRPVPAAAQALLLGVVAPVVALEAAATAAVDHLADGGPCVEEAPLVVELRRRALLARLGADDGQVDAVDRLAQRSLGHPEDRVDGRAALALAVALNEVAPEAGAEAVAVADRRLGAEGALQRVVGVVGPLGGGQDVGDRLARRS